MVFSGVVGNAVDAHTRLAFVRICIVFQKCSYSAAYALFLVLFIRFRSEIETRGPVHTLVWTLFAVIVLCGCVLKLATVGISVAVERDWVTVIADGNSDHLTRLNTYLRRIDLLSKLVAPLFVSLLTTVVSYPFAIAFLLGFGIVSMVFEFLCSYLCKLPRI
jgi:solute carrier family 40 (iron-regulated transporter), member 1